MAKKKAKKKKTKKATTASQSQSGAVEKGQSSQQVTDPVNISSLLSVDEYDEKAFDAFMYLLEMLKDNRFSDRGTGLAVTRETVTVKFGPTGNYVLSRNTPARQLWLSSPLSGLYQFDWDKDTQAWLCKQPEANLYKILDTELPQFRGPPRGPCQCHRCVESRARGGVSY